jgi:hypothetical protein
MTRHVLRAVDLGASVVFMAFCAKAFVTHFYKDLRLQQRQQKFAVVSDAALLTPHCCLYRLNQGRIIRISLRAVDPFRYRPALEEVAPSLNLWITLLGQRIVVGHHLTTAVAERSVTEVDHGWGWF